MRKIVILLSILTIALVIGISPIGDVTRINVHNAYILSDNEIRAMVAEESGNIFAFNSRSARASIAQSPYVYRATIEKNFFRREVDIFIIERVTVAYVRFMDAQYLHIDKDGRVLTVSVGVDSNLPIVSNINLTKFVVGDILHTEEEINFLKIAELASLFITYEIDQNDIEIDISDPNNLRLNYGNIIVSLGNYNNLDYKIRIALSALPEVTSFRDLGGHLNISDINGQWVFSILT